MNGNLDKKIKDAAEMIKNANNVTVFTGAGISVESGIPPFRGEEGLWSRYDPIILDLRYFYSSPKEAWIAIKKLFYDFFGQAEPNYAHIAVAQMEEAGMVNAVITQNIDNLHQAAGSRNVYEYHGTLKTLTCTKCGKQYYADNISLEKLPLECEVCGGLVKPDFVFFGEGIPEEAARASYEAINKSDLFLVIGTTGEIRPASSIPVMAKQNGAKIIEIKVEQTNFTGQITDIFLQGKATGIMKRLVKELKT